MENHDSNIPWDGDMAKKNKHPNLWPLNPFFSIKGPSGGLFIEIPLIYHQKNVTKNPLFFRGFGVPHDVGILSSTPPVSTFMSLTKIKIRSVNCAKSSSFISLVCKGLKERSEKVAAVRLHMEMISFPVSYVSLL